VKEDSIKEDMKNAEYFIKSIKTDKEYKEENGWHGYYNKEIVELARILEHILSDYKRVLKENEKYKRLAEMNLKSAEEFKNNMCEHRCLLKNENKEQKELIEKMKKYLLKENKMCDFLESEE